MNSLDRVIKMMSLVLMIASWAEAELIDGVYHVQPGESIQEALEKAAADSRNKTVRVHAGVYAPEAKAQALIWFNAKHDGITLEAEGNVVLA